jgi:hypothetical protein
MTTVIFIGLAALVLWLWERDHASKLAAVNAALANVQSSALLYKEKADKYDSLLEALGDGYGATDAAAALDILAKRASDAAYASIGIAGSNERRLALLARLVACAGE